MKRKASLWLCVVLAISGAACSRNSDKANSNSSAGAAEAAEARPVVVTSAQAIARQVPVYLQATGSIAGDDVSDVAPQTSGQVIATFVENGDFVRQGQVLARLDDTDARLRVQQARTGVTQAQAALRQAEVRLGLGNGTQFSANATPEVRAAQAALENAESAARLAEQNARRYANLVETGDVARSVYDQFRTQAESARAQVNAARQQLEAARNTARGNNEGIRTAQAGVEAAQAQVALAQQVLDYATIRAPFAGFVQSRDVARGEYVTPASRIATIVRTNPVRLVLQVPEAEAGRINAGAQVSANVSAYPDRQFNGRVRAVNPSLDVASRALQVEVEMENNQNLLKPGMFATARINQPEGTEAIYVPRAAVQTNPNTNSSSVYVIENSGDDGEVARLRVVQIAEAEGDMIRIVSGVRAGETVITSNADELFDGARISR